MLPILEPRAPGVLEFFNLSRFPNFARRVGRRLNNAKKPYVLNTN
jgi:hypothetical protein